MSALQSVVQLVLLCALFCTLMPLLGGCLLHAGLRRCTTPELPAARCMKVFFGAAGAAYLLMLIVGQWLPGSGPVAGVFLTGSVVVFVEVLLIVALLRKFSTRALLAQTAAVLATNLAGYGLAFAFIISSGPILAGR